MYFTQPQAWVAFPILTQFHEQHKIDLKGVCLSLIDDFTEEVDLNTSIFDESKEEIKKEYIKKINYQKLVLQKIADIENTEVYYNGFLQVVEKKSKDVLLKLAKRNQKLELAAYNISHTYSSHVFPYIDKFLEELNEHIYRLMDMSKSIEGQDEMKHNEKIDWFKNYLKDQTEKMIRLSINLAAANDRFNKPVDKAFYSAYRVGDLINKKLAGQYFSKPKTHSDSEIEYENVISLGFTDGEASCILDCRVGKNFNVLIPYGELGVTMLMMLIGNIFRNLKKHSIFSNDVKYVSDYLNEFGFTTDINKRYNLRITVAEAEIAELKDKYCEIKISETSRKYNEQNISFESNSKKISEIADILSARFNDWSDENQENWKGLKEIRMIASVLIGCPTEEIDFTKVNGKDYYIHNGEVFPSKFVSCGVEGDTFYHKLYLRKEQFATIWVKKEYDINQETINNWKHAGITIKKHDMEADSKNPVPFVLDCNSGKFANVENKSMHYNFRFLKNSHDVLKTPNTEEFLDGHDLKKVIQKLWIENNQLLKFINSCEYFNQENPNKFVFGEALSSNTTVDQTTPKSINKNYFSHAVIDEHFKKTSGINQYGYLECNSSKSQNFLLTECNSEVEYLQREAVNAKIVIYDEVIYEQLRNDKKDSDCNKPKIEILKYKNIHVEVDIKGENKQPENIKKTFSGEGTSTLDDFIHDVNCKHIDHKDKLCYIILHYSGFEKLYKNMIWDDNFKMKSEKEKFSYAHNYLIDKIDCKKNSTYIVLCSGKYPNLLPENAFFIDRESLKYHTLTISSKINLMKQLTSLRINKK